MRKFIKRIKRAIKYERAFDTESFAFKIVATFLYMTYMVVYAIITLVLFVTVPIWIIPFAIYYCFKKGGEAE